MKNFLKYFALVLTIGLATLVSCQDEENRQSQSPDLLDKNSGVAQKLQNLTANNTSIDNVIDSTDCFSVKLPVQILVNNLPVTVNTPDDYGVVENLLQNTPTGGSIEFVYPITLITATYQEILVQNEQEFLGAVADCVGFQGTSCLVFNYPVTVNIYDTASQTPSVVTVDNNQEFYLTIFNLGDAGLFEIDYPISASNSSGQNIPINSNQELDDAISAAIADCDCDNETPLRDDLILYLTFAGEVHDLTGFGSSLAQGEIAFVQDRSGNAASALSFLNGDAENQILTAGNANNDMLQDGQFTISLWFNRQNTSDVGPSQEFLFSNSEMSLFISNVNQIEYQPRLFVAGQTLADNTWFQQQLGPQINAWHHAAITFSDGVVLMYRDGNLVAETSNVNFAGTSLPPNFIGGNFRGFVDDVRVYKRALNPGEIQTLFNLEGDTSTCLE